MTGFHQIAFVPLPGSRFNDGYGLSLEYRLLEGVEFTHDFGELVVIFHLFRITLRGTGLAELFELIRTHAVDRIEQQAPGSPPALPLPYCVTAMSRAFI